jgi:hypothetical protein
MATTEDTLTRGEWKLVATGPADAITLTVSEAFAYASTASGAPTLAYQHQAKADEAIVLDLLSGEELWIKTERGDGRYAVDIVEPEA